MVRWEVTPPIALTSCSMNWRLFGKQSFKNICKGWEGADEQVASIMGFDGNIVPCFFFGSNWIERPGQSTTPEQSQEGQRARAWSWFAIAARWPQRENRRFWGGGASSKQKDLLLLVWAFLDSSLTRLFHCDGKGWLKLSSNSFLFDCSRCKARKMPTNYK